MHIKMETLFCVGTLDYKTFKGSYGIHVVRMDGEKGSLTHVSERNDGYNPSFLISNKTGTGIYTVSERLEDGALTFYHLNGEELLFKSALNLPGEGCVHAQMSPDQRFILVACWKTANVIVCSLDSKGVPTEVVCNVRMPDGHVLRQVATNSNLAIGLTMAIIIGGIDLSVGAILAFSGLLCASFISDGMNLGLAVLLAFTLGALFGLLNGLIIAYTNMPPFVVTLATQNIARGIVNVYANGQPISARNPVFNFLGVGYFLGIPLPVIYSFVLLAVMILILGRSKFGRQLYAVGGNEEAARFSGINIKKVKIIVYTLCGALASFSGIILAARMYSGQPTAGDGFELDAIAASVLGGVSFSGGVGKLGGTIIGVLVLGVLTNGLNLLNINSFWQYIIKGIIILLAVYLDILKKRREKD